MKAATKARKVVILIRALHWARKHAPDMLPRIDALLENYDAQRGWSRSKTAASNPVLAVYAKGPQRNPNWKAALNKLNRMRGRAELL